MPSQNFLASIVSGVRVESAWGPTFTVAQPFAASGSGPSPLLTFLKPKVTLLLNGGAEYAITPYGEPGPTKWPMVQAGLIFGGLLLAGFIIQGKIR